MTEHEFMLADRIAKIQSINKLHDLEHNAYISFSGGKDSTVLHYLIDEALPGNNIPRVFINTGIEYKLLVRFVKDLAEKDSRILILNVGKNIKETLLSVGYPFKSKQHSQRLWSWKRGQRNTFINQYFRKEESSWRQCPYSLMYQISPDFKLNISDKCCYEFKKEPAARYMKQSGRKITITGMLKEEGGQRSNLSCIVTTKEGAIKKFHPMSIVSKEWEDWYITHKSIKLCPLYYPPYNFERSGCVGCPFSKELQAQLDTLEQLLPDEKKKAEYLWKPVYDEYRRIGYRLRKDDGQQSLFQEL